MILEPINIGNQQTENASKAAAHANYFSDQLTVLPHDGDKVTVNGKELTWHAVETANYNVNLYYFATAHNTTSANALFWAVTVINCPEEIPNVRLADRLERVLNLVGERPGSRGHLWRHPDGY